MIISNGNKIHDLDYDVIRHWIHLKKGNNSIKSRSNATKVDFDLYYVKSNSYLKSIYQKMTQIVRKTNL